MTKTEALNAFGSVANLVEAIEDITPQAVRQWPEELPSRISDRVIAAAVRSGTALPGYWVPGDAAGKAAA